MVVDEPPSDGDRIATVGFVANKATDLLAGSAALLVRGATGSGASAGGAGACGSGSRRLYP